MTNPAPKEMTDASLSVALLTALLQDEQDAIRNSKTTLGAAWKAMRYGRDIQKALDTSVEALKLFPYFAEKPLATLQRIVAAADAQEIDTTGIKKLLPAIEAITEKAEAEGAGPYKTIKIARQHLRGG